MRMLSREPFAIMSHPTGMKERLNGHWSLRWLAATAATSSLLFLTAGCAKPDPGQTVSLVGWHGSTMVSADGRTITVGGFAGPCFGTVRAYAKETHSQVRLWLRYVTPTQHGVCNEATVLIRSLQVRLAVSLGHRTLVDGATGRPVAFFNGRYLLRPSAIPAGYKLDSIWPLAGILSSNVPGATQVYLSSGKEIDIEQSAGRLTLPLVGGSKPTAIRVRGHEGTATINAISWREHNLNVLIHVIGSAHRVLSTRALIALADSAPA